MPVSIPHDKEVEVESSPIGNQSSLGVEQDEDSVNEYLDGDDDDLKEGDEFGVDVDEILGRQKLNSVATILSLHMKPTSSSRFFIPLCPMVAMPMVRPTLQSDLANLEQEYGHGCRKGFDVFYVSLNDNDGKTQEVTAANMESWGPL